MQIATTPKTAKQVIDASYPKNMTPQQKEALDADWNAKAAKRAEHIARQAKTPIDPNMVIACELRRYGKHWQAFVSRETTRKGNPIWEKLNPSPTIFNSAIDAMNEFIEREAFK